MGSKKTSTSRSAPATEPGPRLPERHGDLQVNACRNPACPNFGVEALSAVDRGRPRKDGTTRQDGYSTIPGEREIPDLKLYCKHCRKEGPIKSNMAIAEELERLSRYLKAPEERGCPTPGCDNAVVGVYTHPEAYVVKAKLKTTRRIQCKCCRREFSIKWTAFSGQKKPHLNKIVFKEIVTKKPVGGIALIAEISPKAVYDKIDFIYRQCVGFVGEREAEAHTIRRKYVRLCIDRQGYMINWKSRRRRRNIQFSSICTVEGKTRYVMDHHLNFDPDRNQVAIDDIAKINGDWQPGAKSYFHAHAQYWKSEEFYDIGGRRETEIRPDLKEEPLVVDDLIAATRRAERTWPRHEMADYPAAENQLPPDGVMTHLDYTAYAHAILMRRLAGRPSHMTIYTDQDEVLRGAFTSAFRARIAADRVAMAYVQFQKKMTIDEREQLA